MRSGLILLMLLLCAPLLAPANESVANLISEGEAKLQSGEFGTAIRLLEQAVSVDARSSLAHTRLGGALLLNQEQLAAIEQFREAVKLDAGNAEAFIGMAIAYIHLGRGGLARGALEEAKRIDPKKRQAVDELIVWIDSDPSEGAHSD